MNLHAYHPTGATERYFEDRSGQKKKAPADIFYFTPDELKAGYARRNYELSKWIDKMDFDLVLLQEVVAGTGSTTNDCKTFYSTQGRTSLGSNSALALKYEINSGGNPMQAALACRGNIGWFTSENQFHEKRVVRLDSKTQEWETIIDFDENPYPRGMVVEGMAVLYSKHLKLIEQAPVELRTSANKPAFYQWLVFSSGQKIFAVANIHSANKVEHFEQAVAIRADISKRIKERKDIAAVIIGGDFNAALFRSNRNALRDPAMLPWMPFQAGFYDFRISAWSNSEMWEKKLSDELHWLNSRKDRIWANIEDPLEANYRIDKSLEFFKFWQEKIALDSELKMTEAISDACKTFHYPHCDFSKRIDHLFLSQHWQIRNGRTERLDQVRNPLSGWSDHPIVWADVEIKD